MATYRRTIGPNAQFGTVNAWVTAIASSVAAGNIEEGVITEKLGIAAGATQTISGTTTTSSFFRLMTGTYDSQYLFLWSGGAGTSAVNITISTSEGNQTKSFTKAELDSAAEIKTALESFFQIEVGDVDVVLNSFGGSEFQIFFGGKFRGVEDVEMTVGTPTGGTIAFSKLAAASNSHFDPVTKSGGYLVKNLWRDSGAAGFLALEVLANFTDLRGVAIYSQPALGEPEVAEGIHYGIYIDADDCTVNRCFVKYSHGYAATMACFVNNGDRNQHYNCIAVGGRAENGFSRGANYGFTALTTVTTNSRYHNCLAFACNNTGFDLLNFTNASQACRNSVAFRCTTPFEFSSFNSFTNVSHLLTDGTLPSGVTNGIIGADLESNFIDAYGDDFRHRLSSEGIDNANDNSTNFTNDFTGKARLGTWDRGPYEGYGTEITSEPIETEFTIGVGQDYATIADFLEATRVNLIGLNVVYTGIVYDNNLTLPTYIYGGIGDDTRYRQLKFKKRYDPITGQGSKISTTGTNILERGFRITGLLVESNVGGGSTNAAAISIRDTDCRLDAVTVRSTAATGSSSAEISGINFQKLSGSQASNCLVLGISGVGFNRGFHIEVQDSLVGNCIAYGINDGASGIGIDASSVQCTIANCVSGACRDAAFDILPNSSFNNMSDDTSALEFPSTVFTEVFVRHSSNDFRLKEGSPAENLGLDLAEFFDSDFIGVIRTTPWELGLYDGVVYPPPTAKIVPGSTHRKAILINIERTDGVILRLTDSSYPIPFRGSVYYPSKSVNASATEDTAGVNDNKWDVEGGISSTVIVREDLLADRFNDAIVTRFIVDWKYPHAEPFRVDQWVIEAVSQDDDTWRAQLAGLFSTVAKRSGANVTRQCDTTFGSTKCGIDLKPLTVKNCSVDSVISSKRKFTALGMDTSKADKWYTFGVLTWTSGANAGLISEIKLDIQGSSRELEIQLNTPFAITIGDTFTAVPGCALTFSACKFKWNNLINYQGWPYMKGPRKLMEAPKS